MRQSLNLCSFYFQLTLGAIFNRRVRILTDAPVQFGVIPPEHWYQPEWIDEDLARRGRLRMMEQGVIYGGKLINPLFSVSSKNSSSLSRQRVVRHFCSVRILSLCTLYLGIETCVGLTPGYVFQV